MPDKIEHIQSDDVLNTGREKINKFAIDPAMRAEVNSLNAKNTANQANQTSSEAKEIAENTDERLDNILAGEMEDAEVIDARKPFSKDSYTTLGQRLNAMDTSNTAVNERVETLNQRFRGHVNTDSAITNLLNIGLTYTEQSKIRYGQQGTAASANNTGKLHDDGFYYMDCSSFVEIVLRGVEYQNSAYENNGANYPTSEGFYFDTNFEHLYDRFLANEQAKYCLEHGWAFEPNDDLTNVMPGDLIFMTGATEPDYFLNIGHVGFVLNKDQNSNLTLLEQGNANGNKIDDYGAQITQYGKGWLKARVPLIGRIPIKEASQEVKNVNLAKSISQNNVFYSQNELKHKKVYTIIFDADITTGYIAFGENTSNYYYNFLSHITRLPNNKYKATFVIPSDKSVSQKRLGFYGLGGAGEVVIDKVKLFEGVVTNYDPVELETGSQSIDSNGVVFKLGNGLMICLKTFNDVGPNKTQLGDVWLSDVYTWTFPEEFYTTENLVVNFDTSLSGRWATMTTSPTRGEVTFQTISAVEHNSLSNVFAMAIGRCK